MAPFLVGVTREEVTGPLSQFQSTLCEKEDVLRLLRTINKHSTNPRTPEQLASSFEFSWDRFLGRIALIDLYPDAPPIIEEEEEPEPREPDISGDQLKILEHLANRGEELRLRIEDIATAIKQNETLNSALPRRADE